MDILNQIIHLMNKEEVRHFKLFTARTKVTAPRKDLQLFDYIRKHLEDFDENEILEDLYPSRNKNSYYRLKNRLIQDLNKSLNLQHMEDDDVMHVFHLMSLARYFHHRNKYKIALHFVKKAEKKSIKTENYELLDFIYSEYIKLSHEIIFINPEEYIEKRKANQKKLMALREIEDILAAVIYRVKMTQNFSNRTDPLFDLLQKTVDEFTQNSENKGNPKLRFTIYQAVSRILAGRQEYEALESYLLKTYEEFLSEGLFNKSNHELKLKMLVFIVNTLYSTRKHTLSLQYADQLYQAMEDHNKLLFQKFLPYYYNAQIINYFKLDQAKSIELLEEVIKKRYFEEDPYNEFVYIVNLAICYFDTTKYKKALKTLVKAKIHDGYDQVEPAFRMRIAVTEITARLPVGDFEVIERQLEEVRRDYKNLLEEDSSGIGFKLLDLLEELNQYTGLPLPTELKNRIFTFLDEHSEQVLNSYSFIDYHAWIKTLYGHSQKVGA